MKPGSNNRIKLLSTSTARVLGLVLSVLVTACDSPEPEGPAPLQVITEPTAEPTYESSQAVYIAMPDGVRIAADIWLPDGLASPETIPTLISFTRYWRGSAYDPPSREKPELFAGLNAAGYAVVVVDTRGSGASFGSRETEFSVCETRDFKHVVDWVADQPWSNGRVAALGVSYSGNTAEHATFDPSPALRAVIPRFTDFDGYTSILYPGGLRNTLITDNWGDAVHALDNNQVPQNRSEDGDDEPVLLGVKPVDADHDGSLLSEAVQQHATNLKLKDYFAGISFRDEINFAASIPADDAAADCSALVSPYRFREAVEANQVPAFHWGSWQDAGTAAGVLARFSSYTSPGRYIIGSWSHGANHDTGVFNEEDQPVDLSVEDQYGRILEFLAPFMTGNEGGKLQGSELTYFTMGEDQWKTTSTWPPEGQVETSWYLAKGHTLVEQPAVSDGEDQYTVDFEAGTGSKSRWTTQLGGGDVYYSDRAEADRRLLTYTSAPLDVAMEVTGHPRVELYVSSSETDGALIAYLETVSPEGVVTMITEGALRLIHRKTLPPDQAPYPMFGPYHSFESDDAEPMVPGEPALIEFGMWPTSVLVPAGHSLRLAIAGHDKDTFARYPATGNPILTLHRNQVQPSRLVIPVIRSQ